MNAKQQKTRHSVHKTGENDYDTMVAKL